jgi:hypothetical protein
MWLHMDESDLERIDIKDQHLRLTLAFGIGMHHAGLVERDRKVVEELFVNQKIQVKTIKCGKRSQQRPKFCLFCLFFSFKKHPLYV